MSGTSLIRKIVKTASTLTLSALMIASVGELTGRTDAAQRYYRDRHGRLVRVYPQHSYGRYPGYVASDLDDRAREQGYVDGFQRGQYDRSTGRRTPNPSGHGAFQYGLNGWSRDLGSTAVYRQYYRQSFIQGYQDAFFGRSRRW